MLCNLVDFKGIYAVLAQIEICREIRVFVLILGLKYSSVLFCTLFPSLVMIRKIVKIIALIVTTNINIEINDDVAEIK